MYLGSRPAASVARWTARSDVAAAGHSMHDCYVGWPVNHGQPVVKHHVRSHCVAATSSLREDISMETSSNSPLTFSQDFTDYHQRWPKSEFELASEEQNSDSFFGEDNVNETNSQLTKSIQRSCNSENDMNVTTTEGDETMTTSSRAGKQETFFELDISSASDDGGRHLIKAACDSEEREFLETELVYNRQAKALTSSSLTSRMEMRRKTPTPTTTTTTTTPSPPQLPSSSSRRRVHPVSKFTDELVNWMPHVIDSSSDDEREQHHVVEEKLEHCSCGSKEQSNGTNASLIRVKGNKRPSRPSRHQSKRKRITLGAAATVARPIQQAQGKDGSNRRRKQHNPWSVEETKMLIKGVAICGEGKWADIKRLEFKELVSRSPVDLKDKWRNLLRLAQLTQNHPRVKKVEKRTDLPSELLHQVRKLGSQQK
eukprot:g5249.t1